MRNENNTWQASQSDDIRKEIAQMRESVEITRSDIRRAKNDIAHYQDAHESHVRRTKALWVIVILMVAAAAGFSLYGPLFLKEHQGLLAKMPVLQSGLDNLNASLISAQQQIGTWANDRAGISDRMSKIEQSVSSNLKTVRNEARLKDQQTQNDTGQRLQGLQNRVTGVESIQSERAEEVARLRNELAGVRQELASVREETARHTNEIRQVEQAHVSTRNDLSGLDRRLSSNQTKVSTLTYQVERKRIDFELQNDRTQQVVDGIYLTVKNTDVGKQRVDGWVQIASDGRFVWLRGESAQNPIEFSSRADARPYQLVFTRVGRGTASGYVLAPISSASADTN